MDWSTILIVAVIIALFLVVKQLGQVSKASALNYLKEGARVIDVRSPGEFESGHLPNALNLPLGELREQAARLLPDKEQVLLLHCLSGTRSGMGRRILKRMGYAKVFNLGSYGRAERIVRESGV
jgi:phage shock protein E